jgi:hypothetical protein
MNKARACFWSAAGVFAVFVADIVAAKAQIMTGTTIPVHLSNALQFVVLLVAIILFVAGALIREREERKQAGEPT